MYDQDLLEKYGTLRKKYFSDPNYASIKDIDNTRYNFEYLYEFNFLTVLLNNEITGCFSETAQDMSNVIKNYQDYPEINWPTYIDYIDEVRATLSSRDPNEVEIYEAINEIRSKIGTVQNNQQLWV